MSYLCNSRIVAKLCDTKVNEDWPLPLHHDVGWFKIPVQDIYGVNRTHGVTKIFGKSDKFSFGKDSDDGDILLQRAPVDESGDDESVLILRLNVEDLGHIRPVHLTQHLHFTTQAIPTFGCTSDMFEQVLQRNTTTGTIHGLIHLGHTAGPKSLDDPVSANLLTI